MSVWCVKPEEVTLDLSYTDPKSGAAYPFWIKVKKYLTVGEERRVMTAGWKGISNLGSNQAAGGGAPEIHIDWRAQSFSRTEAYLTDWSLENDDRIRLAITREVLESLEPAVFVIIENAITAHVERCAEEKKRKPGNEPPLAMSA